MADESVTMRFSLRKKKSAGFLCSPLFPVLLAFLFCRIGFPPSSPAAYPSVASLALWHGLLSSLVFPFLFSSSLPCPSAHQVSFSPSTFPPSLCLCPAEDFSDLLRAFVPGPCSTYTICSSLLPPPLPLLR